MQTRVQQWGNSIALRIPKSFAQEAKIGANSSVELTVSDGKLVITPLRSYPSLAELLAGVTDENRHDAIDFGLPQGAEE